MSDRAARVWPALVRLMWVYYGLPVESRPYITNTDAWLDFEDAADWNEVFATDPASPGVRAQAPAVRAAGVE